MFLVEPPPSPWDVHFRLLGIPVRIHPWFWLAAILLTLRDLLDAPNVQGILSILIPWMAAFLISILIHELGHALTMRTYGRWPRITLYGFGGMTSSGNDELYTSRGFTALGEVLIAAAGPAAGFLLAGLVVLVCNVTGNRVEFSFGGTYGLHIGLTWKASVLLGWFVVYVLNISIFWGLINLMPIYPLDGGQIARELLMKWNPRQGIRLSLVLSVAAAGGLAVVGLLLWRDLFVAFLFGYLAYSSYMALEAYRSRW